MLQVFNLLLHKNKTNLMANRKNRKTSPNSLTANSSPAHSKHYLNSKWKSQRCHLCHSINPLENMFCVTSYRSCTITHPSGCTCSWRTTEFPEQALPPAIRCKIKGKSGNRSTQSLRQQLYRHRLDRTLLIED